MSARRFLILHGFGNRRPRTHWEWWLTEQLRRRNEIAVYPQMPNPDAPKLDEWLELLAAEWDQMGDGERIVVCHSLACALWYQAAARGVLVEPADRVLLVAPAGASVLGRPEMIEFLPAEWLANVFSASSRARIRLIASDADPCCTEGPAEEIYGRALGFDAETLVGAGHLTSADGFGPWPRALEWCLDGQTRFTDSPRPPNDANATLRFSSGNVRYLQVHDLLMSIDRSRPDPLGRQLEDQLRNAIRSGALPAATMLPSTRALAEDLDVSRGVVGHAYGQLAIEGYLDLRQGARPRVRRRPAEPTTLGPSPARSAQGKVQYDLRADQPEAGAFPRLLWLRSLRDALATATDGELGEHDERGSSALRIELATYLRRARGVLADPERIVVTGGSMHSFSTLLRVLARSRLEVIGIENPSSLALRNLIVRAGHLPFAVPVDLDGIQTDSLNEVQTLIVGPAHQFPTGAALSTARRAQITAWAHSGGLVIEDDSHAEFRFGAPTAAALQTDAPESVAYVGSTAMTLAPALRLGWAVLPTKLVEPVTGELGRMQVSTTDQLAFADFLRRGEFDRHLRRRRTLYRRRREVLLAALSAHLPNIPVSATAAGVHLVIELPSLELEQEVVDRARAAGLLLESLSHCALHGYDGPAGILLGYGSLPEAAIPHVVEQLARIVRSRPAVSPHAARARTVLHVRTRPRSSCCC